MKAFCICTFLITLFICSRDAFAFQANTPEAALEEMATAETLDKFIKHLPLNVQEAIDKLAAKEKDQVAGRLLFRNLTQSKGVTLHKKDDGSAWEVINEKHEVEGSIKLKNSFISGTDALVVLEATENKELKSNGDPDENRDGKRGRMRMLVSMRLEEGEWRVSEFGPWNSQSLESEDFLRGLVKEKSGEFAAETTLRILSTILETYKSTYPDIGFPQSLQALCGPEGAEASADHAMLLDGSFMAVPLVKDGYQFQYTLVDPGTGKEHEGHYRITATPVEFSRNGGRSLFTDQTRVIRATADHRDANENDDPIGGSSQDDN